MCGRTRETRLHVRTRRLTESGILCRGAKPVRVENDATCFFIFQITNELAAENMMDKTRFDLVDDYLPKPI